MRRGLLAALPLLLVAVAHPAPSISASLSGQVYTADHPDSIAASAAVTLIYRDRDGELARVETVTDRSGRFRYQDLDGDTSLAYVLRIDDSRSSFLSAPIRYAAGQEEIDFNVLLTPGSMQSDIPSGHPSLDGGMAQGRPVEQKPIHTALIVLAVVSAYGLLARWARPR